MRIFYDERLNLPESPYQSLTKPGRFMTALMGPDGLGQARLSPVEPVLEHEVLSVHDYFHTRNVLECRVSGFGGSSPALVRQVLLANGAMRSAVHHVLTSPNERLACAPVSGFHHAGVDFSSGFCTLNGLMIALASAYANDFLARGEDEVLIIDGDGHYGNGTDDIIKRDPKQFSGVYNLTRGNDADHPLRWNEHNWAAQLEFVLNWRPWALVLYQAGADAHRDDPYGAGCLSDGDWLDRDIAVFKHVTERNVPCVWNLAGGYNGAKTISLHVGTAVTAVRLEAQARRARTLAPSQSPAAAPTAPAQAAPPA